MTASLSRGEACLRFSFYIIRQLRAWSVSISCMYLAFFAFWCFPSFPLFRLLTTPIFSHLHHRPSYPASIHTLTSIFGVLQYVLDRL
ncbi:hypothetical protein F4801DRAFT_278453 [Xylaria longipes]|nr:hypothetical protein F4801DRAFT_278453 [Xylaria longipes]